MTYLSPITPSSPEPSLPFEGSLLTFRKRMKDFVWGTDTGDLICDEGYRIYIAWFRPNWVVALNGKRLGEYPDLQRAVERADSHFLRRIERGEIKWDNQPTP